MNRAVALGATQGSDTKLIAVQGVAAHMRTLRRPASRRVVALSGMGSVSKIAQAHRWRPDAWANTRACPLANAAC